MRLLVRVVWGCLITALSLSAVGEVVLGLFGNVWVSRVVFIAAVGFGPLLFPLGSLKLLCFFWGFLGSFYLLGRYPPAGGMAYLLAAWGPLIAVAAADRWSRGRRDMGFSKGESVLRDKSGRMADWTFQADGLEIAVDLAAGELRVRARRAHWSDASSSFNEGPVTLIRPLLECSLGFSEVVKTEHRGTLANVYGRTISGESICVSVPQPGHSIEYATGEMRVVIDHRSTEWRVAQDYVLRWGDGSLRYHGRVERTPGARNISVELGPLPKDVSAKLLAQWESSATPKIAALEAVFKSSLLAKAETVAVDNFLLDEKARAGV
jgi:hypothetical protein